MSTGESPQLKQLWGNWIATQDNISANGLLKHYMYLVSFHADRIAVHLPGSVSREDLESFGLIGLFDALHKFDPDRKLKFDTYASFRVRGAIIDGLRKEDWLPRSLREKTKRIEWAAQELEQELQRQPTAAEIGKKTGMTAKEVEKHVNDALFAHVLSIEEKPKESDGDFAEGVGYTIPAADSVLPDEYVMENERKDQLAEGIKQLNKNEQLVISLFYHDELTLTEIGQILELTTSRISQIHKQAIFKLRKLLGKGFI
jgi:RNA polymerase sigma factor for flagellar operon FliA